MQNNVLYRAPITYTKTNGFNENSEKLYKDNLNNEIFNLKTYTNKNVYQNTYNKKEDKFLKYPADSNMKLISKEYKKKELQNNNTQSCFNIKTNFHFQQSKKQNSQNADTKKNNLLSKSLNNHPVIKKQPLDSYKSNTLRNPNNYQFINKPYS